MDSHLLESHLSDYSSTVLDSSHTGCGSSNTGGSTGTSISQSAEGGGGHREWWGVLWASLWGKKEKEKGLILMYLATVAYWASLHCWRCLGVEKNRRRHFGNKAQALTENNQLNFFVRITWGISWCFHSAVVHAMVPPHDLTDDKVCSCGTGTERSVSYWWLADTAFRLHLKRALCLQEIQRTASPLFPSIAITFKQSHLSPLRTPTNSIHCQSMFSVLLEANLLVLEHRSLSPSGQQSQWLFWQG